ncbi:hypothetical protein WOLCODRAFT_137755 [Wolfiporia cocos MD-104 SS10]|uniref:Uncharacterized protein n=1 Tax=Wolfiporia cocos (strain MD-104) TaxID=742152 RepID=A0A2H3JK17_WOLCO|nr:hypothetical protein WOLCODRAFT_137755 [Wolfiporia cocos MD-104 SS10]
MNTITTTRAAGLRAVLRARRVAPTLRTYATPVKHENEDDPQLGDYPHVPAISKQYRPARGWQDPQMRRNFGEPPHPYEEMLSMWGPDAPHVPPSTALGHFTIAWLAIAGFGAFTYYNLVPQRLAVPREYPYDGLVVELGGLEENKAQVETVPDEE